MEIEDFGPVPARSQGGRILYYKLTPCCTIHTPELREEEEFEEEEEEEEERQDETKARRIM